MAVRRKKKRVPSKDKQSATRLSIKSDDAMRLLRDIMEHRIDPKDLTTNQRRACLVLTADGKQSVPELAALFKMSMGTIRKDLKAVREELGREVREWSIEHVLGRLVMKAEKYQAAALKNEDTGLAWAIERDTIKLLKELGVISAQDDKNALTITIEALGEGYERARKVIGSVMESGKGLDPRLTGEVVNVKEYEREASPMPALPLDSQFADTPAPPPEEA